MRTAAAPATACILALAAAGCSQGGSGPPSPACSESPAAVERALQAAPGRVALPDGTLISTCVEHSQRDADLQNVGSVLSTVADDLARRAGSDPAAATQLGFLVGAARRGAAHINGVAAELVHRLEQTGAAAPVHALAGGLRAGERHG